MPRRVRVPVLGLTEGPRELTDDAGHYLARVHRLRVGDTFVAFDPEAGLECDGVVTQIARGGLTCELSEPRKALLTGALPLSLLQGVGKGDRVEEVVRAATALGVRRIHLLTSERSVALVAGHRYERLRGIAMDAARQSGRGDLPVIAGPNPLDRALETTSAALKICLHPRAREPLDRHLAGWTALTEVALLVGPEGGFSDGELERIVASGFVLGALGPLTLRTELAGLAALGCFAARLPGAPDAL